MLQADNLQTQLGKPCCELGAVHFCTYRHLILRNQQHADSLSTYSCTGGRSLMPVLFYQSSPSLAFSSQGVYSEMFFHVNTQWPKEAFFFILLPKIPISYPKIKLCMYISSLHYQHSLSCTILFQTPPTCSPSEGRGRSYREDVEIQETSKLQKAGDEQLYHKKKTNKTKTKCRNS